VLLSLCGDYDDGFADLQEVGATLNEYIVAGRYPGDLAFEEIGVEEAQEAVATTRRIRELVSVKLTSSPPSGNRLGPRFLEGE
jgi:hypothetical protein